MKFKLIIAMCVICVVWVSNISTSAHDFLSPEDSAQNYTRSQIENRFVHFKTKTSDFAINNIPYSAYNVTLVDTENKLKSSGTVIESSLGTSTAYHVVQNTYQNSKLQLAKIEEDLAFFAVKLPKDGYTVQQKIVDKEMNRITSNREPVYVITYPMKGRLNAAMLYNISDYDLAFGENKYAGTHADTLNGCIPSESGGGIFSVRGVFVGVLIGTGTVAAIDANDVDGIVEWCIFSKLKFS